MNSRISNLYQKPTSGVSAMEMLAVPVSGSGVVSFATTYSTLTKGVAIDVQDSDVYVTFTGETPSASLGHRLYAGRSYTFNVVTASSAKFLNTSASVAGTIASTELSE